jgi:hypothetical protein
MKLRLLLVPAVCLSLLVFSAVSASSQTVLTFDDIFSSNPPSGLLITNGYQGLNWVNFGVLNVPLTVQNQGITGCYYGMASASNVAVNGFGNGADIISPVTNFNFVSAYLTGAFNSNLNIEVQGFSGSNILYDETVVAGATNRTLFTFNYSGIDRIHFNAFGGQLLKDIAALALTIVHPPCK